jgi:hypothetical protein
VLDKPDLWIGRDRQLQTREAETGRNDVWKPSGHRLYGLTRPCRLNTLFLGHGLYPCIHGHCYVWDPVPRWLDLTRCTRRSTCTEGASVLAIVRLLFTRPFESSLLPTFPVQTHRVTAMQQLQLHANSRNVGLQRQRHVARAAAAGVVRTSVPLNAKPLKPR